MDAHKNDGVTYKPSEVCKIIASSPAPRFYVSAECAANMMYKVKHGYVIKKKKAKEMHEEITRRFEEMNKSLGNCVYKFTIMENVVKQPAPSFYLEPGTAPQFYYLAMRHKRERARKC